MLHSLLAVLVLSPLGQQDQAYPVFETDKIAPAEHKARRERLMQQMGPGSIGVFFTHPTRQRNNDVDFMFRGDSNFIYLTGFEEPDAALVLIPDGVELEGKRVREVLFVNVADQMSQTWLGYRMGPASVKTLLGIEAAYPNTEFTRHWPILAAGATGRKLATAYVPNDANGRLATMVTGFRNWREGAGYEPGIRATQVLTQMRQIKSAAEIALIKRAAEISVKGHIEVLRSIEPGMREWEISALVKYIFYKEGCEYEGYPPICGSGPNSTILHYNTNRRLMNAGEVVCMDTAGEYHNYTADVTRSFPVNGKFTAEQRAIYNVVLASQTAGIEACRVGNSVSQISKACSDKLADGLINLGIISNRSELGRYYMHGFGHGLGLDVHDPMPNVMAPGAVLTVEPGIYIKAGSPCDKKWWNIGIRIEDDILVTEKGPVNLSAGCPRGADAIEKLMAEKGLGNVKIKPYGK